MMKYSPVCLIKVSFTKEEEEEEGGGGDGGGGGGGEEERYVESRFNHAATDCRELEVNVFG